MEERKNSERSDGSNGKGYVSGPAEHKFTLLFPSFPSAWKEIPLYPPLSWFLPAQEPMHSQVDMHTKLAP